MNLTQSLTRKKTAILRKWATAVFDTYPGDTAAFLQREQDRFANPVGYATTISLEKILDGLLAGSDIQSISPCLDDIIKIRAVQDFTPSQAVSFPLLLKKIIIDEIKIEQVPAGDWIEFESKIDALSLLAFDTYARMREKIYHIRRKELEKNERFFTMLMESRAVRCRDASSDPSAFNGCTLRYTPTNKIAHNNE